MKLLRFYKYFNEIIIKCKKNMRDEEFTNDSIVLITSLFEVNENILEMSSKKELSEKFITELQKGLNSSSARINDIMKVSSLQNDIDEISTPNNNNLNWDFSIFEDNKNDIFDIDDYKKDFGTIQQQNQLKINNSTSMGLLLQFRMNKENQNSDSSVHSSNILGSENNSRITIANSHESLSDISSSIVTEDFSDFEESNTSAENSMNESDNIQTRENEIGNEENNENYNGNSEIEEKEEITIGTSRSQIKRKKLFKPKYKIGNMIIYKSSKIK